MLRVEAIAEDCRERTTGRLPQERHTEVNTLVSLAARASYHTVVAQIDIYVVNSHSHLWQRSHLIPFVWNLTWTCQTSKSCRPFREIPADVLQSPGKEIAGWSVPRLAFGIKGRSSMSASGTRQSLRKIKITRPLPILRYRSSVDRSSSYIDVCKFMRNGVGRAAG